MLFLGAKFCSHCGALARRATSSGDGKHACPRCKLRLQAVTVGQTQLHECQRCGGLWADQASVEHIYADREKQVQVLGAVQAIAPGTPNAEIKVRYLPCPYCAKLMNRVNFGRCSSIIVDVCRDHGTWFDRDELRRIVEFIRSGGFDEARRREVAELENRKRRLEQSLSTPHHLPGRNLPLDATSLDIGLSAAAEIFAQLIDS
jgi:Zn-finger nucleic acid-binding protein